MHSAAHYAGEENDVSGLFKKLKKLGKKIDPITVTKKSLKETKRAINNPAVKKAAAVVASGAAIYFTGGAATPAVLAAWKMDADRRAAKKAAKQGDLMPTEPPMYVVDELEKGAGYPLDLPHAGTYGGGGGGSGGGVLSSEAGSKFVLIGGAALAALLVFGKSRKAGS